MEYLTEEQKFHRHLESDDTFWGHLFRNRGAKSFKDALRIEAEFVAECRKSTPSNR